MAERSLKNKLIIHDSDDGDDDYHSTSYASEMKTQKVTVVLISLEKLTLGPRKKLLVFSLNGLIVHRVSSHNRPEIPINRTPDGRYGSYLVFKRPFAEEFMQFCLERFEVGIWSSAQEKNVDGVLDCVMGSLKKQAYICLGKDQHECTDSGFKSLEKKTKPLFFKELKKVWDHFGGKYSESDTLYIDDKPYKALLNPLNTGIFLEPCVADNDIDKALDPKGELGKYLDGLADARDVQIYVKENPFGQPPISADHPDWKFYSSVLRRLGKQYKC